MSQRNKALLITVVVLLAVVLVALLLFLRAALDYKGTVEAIPGEIVAQQRIGVDAVSGATDSSTVIQKAVENALTGAG